MPETGEELGQVQREAPETFEPPKGDNAEPPKGKLMLKH